MRDGRREACGAVFTERCDSLDGLRGRGTVTSAPYISTGPRGNRALWFDGTDDKYAVVVNKSINTFEAWVYFTTTTEEVADFDGGTHKLKATDGTLAATGWTSPTIYVDGVATTTVTTGWHHIAVTSATAFTCTTLSLGTDGTGFGAVRIADVSLWSRVLSAAEVAQEAAGTTFDYNLYEAIHWDMSEVNAQDVGYRGTGSNLTGSGLVASTDIVAAPYAGDRATEYNGSDEYSERVEADWRSSDTMGAISMLIRRNTTGVWVALLSSCDTATDENQWTFGVGAGNVLNVNVVAGGVPITSQNGSTVIASGQLRHVVLSSNGSAYTMAVDGLPETITTSVGTNTGEWLGDVPNRDSVTLGVRQMNARALYLNGMVVDVRYYTQPITALQASDLNSRLKRGE